MVTRLGNSKEGSVLILALWTIVSLSILSIGLAQSVQQKINNARRLEERETSRTLIESVAKMIADAMKTSGMEKVLSGNSPISASGEFAFPGGTVKYEITDENRKININTASQQVFKDLFHKAANLGEGPAESLGYAIVDYRDQDDFVGGIEGAGTEKDGYEQDGRPGPKNGNFEFLSELLSVKGMTKEIYNSVRNYITIYSDGRININTATEEILKIFDCDQAILDRIVSFRNGDDLRAGTADDRKFQDVSTIEADLAKIEPLSANEKSALMRLTRTMPLTTVSDNYRVVFSAHLSNHSSKGAAACVFNSQGGIQNWVES